MDCAHGIPELDDYRSLADIIRWMNAQHRPKGADKVVWRHTPARKQLELLGLRFTQKGPRCKLYFRLSDLVEVAPLLASAYLGPGAYNPPPRVV